MLAVDDGLTSGNLNAADVLFLIGLILGFLAALLSLVKAPPFARFAPLCAYAAIGCIAFGLFLL